MSIEKMKYVSEECLHEKTPIVQYDVYANLERYRGVFARNKVIFRVDLAELICKDYYLSDSNLSTISKLLCNEFMMCDYFGESEASIKRGIAHTLETYYRKDIVFRRRLSQIYYIDYRVKTASTGLSYFACISQDFRKRFEKIRKEFYDNVDAKGFNAMYWNGSECYFSIDDEVDNVLKINSKYKVEVVSSAKNWRGVIENR